MAARSVAKFAWLRIARILALLAFAAPAFAEHRWGGSIAVTNDYVYRGISQSRGEPAVQGGLHLQWPSGWSAGVWASTVDFNRGGATAEIDVHLARSWSLDANWDFSAGITHYFYANDAEELPYDYDELIASIAYKRQLSATVAWSPNIDRYSGGRPIVDRQAASYEVTFLQPLAASWSVVAGIGYYDLSELVRTGYWYWNAGITYSLGALQVDVSHIGSDDKATELFGWRATGSRWSAALAWRF